MKNGKFINLGFYNNIKIGYGTVDHKDLKTIYVKLNCWLEPIDNQINYSDYLMKSRKKIKRYFYNMNCEYFKPESIVDLDVKTKGLKLSKKSFMDLDITLFVSNQFEIKSKLIKNKIKNIVEDLIISCLINDDLYKFHKKKN